VLSALAAAGLAAVTAAGPPSAPAGAGREALLRAPDLDIHLRSGVPAVAVAVAGAARPGLDGTAAPPCLGDVCQPRVSVPGFEPRFSRPSRTELALAYLDRVRLEPFATIAWALVWSGLRLDYSPPVFEGPSQAPAGWGAVFLRVKFRVDADNVPVVPARHPRSPAADGRGGS
jgi:hypothetical protein